MTDLNLTPTRAEISQWGTLAYVTDAERQRIMALPCGQSRHVIERIKAEIKESEKNEDKRIASMQSAAQAMPSGGYRRDMAEQERMRVKQLQDVRFPSQSKDKGFVVSMAQAQQITEKQAAYIRALVYKYRRQL